LAGKLSALEQKNAGACAGRGDGRGGAGGAAADYDEVESGVGVHRIATVSRISAQG
jgi:hypothetical protein